jgi:hypothetical protein
MEWMLLVPFLLALFGVPWCARVLPSLRARRIWYTSVLAFLGVTVIAFWLRVALQPSEESAMPLDAWRKVGVFLLMTLVVFDGVVVAAASGLVGGIALLRRAIVAGRGVRPGG